MTSAPLLSLDAVTDQRILWDEEFKRLGRQNIAWFTRYTNPRYRMAWHNALTCKYLMQWINGEIPFLIISEPPRHGKSELGSRRLAPFIFGINPDAKIISASYGQALASKVNREVQGIMENERYKTLFPGTRLKDKTNYQEDPKARKNAGEFSIVGREGEYRAVGVGGPISGTGANYLIIDDPVKNQKEADSPTYQQSVWDWWSSTALTRLEDHPRVLVIMTRWHEGDLAGRLLQQAKDDPYAFKFKELRLEGIKEDMTLHPTEDPRKYGEALWPGKYPIERLMAIKGSIAPRWWNALYQQRPTALDGNLIKREQIKYWTYDTLPSKFRSQILSFDMSFKGLDRSDYVAGGVFADQGADVFLLDSVRGRWDFNETVTHFKAFAAKYPKAMLKLVEDKANGPAVESHLKREIPGIVLVDPQGDKYQRLEAASPRIISGNFFVPHPSIAPWVKPYIEELVKFPNAVNDDWVDMTSQALLHFGGALKRMSLLTTM